MAENQETHQTEEAEQLIQQELETQERIKKDAEVMKMMGKMVVRMVDAEVSFSFSVDCCIE